MSHAAPVECCLEFLRHLFWGGGFQAMTSCLEFLRYTWGEGGGDIQEHCPFNGVTLNCPSHMQNNATVKWLASTMPGGCPVDEASLNQGNRPLTRSLGGWVGWISSCRVGGRVGDDSAFGWVTGQNISGPTRQRPRTCTLASWERCGEGVREYLLKMCGL